jgi:hypothetical protein
MRRHIQLVRGALMLGAMAMAAGASAQIRVNPTGVNVNSQNATTVFLTFGGLNGYVPADAMWCGDLMPAAPDVGLRCNPATIFGSLPIRFDRSRASGTNGFTDIMSIPPSVARRAYQDAERGRASGFFYVRRFVRPGGGPDQYVAVTCRLGGGGARVPFSLLDVRVAFDVETPILFVAPKTELPPIKAEIAYNGTGRLKGRWEIVFPGEEPPSTQDLLTEATLPVEQRGLQRRYTELARFNVFLPPTGRYTLEGPDPRRLPAIVEGSYLVLLRIEASDDKEADSNLAAVGAGQGIVHSGAAAGFPMPPLRYFVGNATSEIAAARSPSGFGLALPAENARVAADSALEFTWHEVPQAAVYRLDLETETAQPVLSALVERGPGRYRAPPWIKERGIAGRLRWRVIAISAAGQEIQATPWRGLELTAPDATP